MELPSKSFGTKTEGRDGFAQESATPKEAVVLSFETTETAAQRDGKLVCQDRCSNVFKLIRRFAAKGPLPPRQASCFFGSSWFNTPNMPQACTSEDVHGEES